MSGRTGLGAQEEAILVTLESSGSEFVSNEWLLTRIDAATGLGPRYLYPVVCDLRDGSKVAIRLLDGKGNFGGVDDPPADARYTKSRLSAAGQLAAAAERGEYPRLPIDLINGTHYRGGTRPPFDPERMINALARVLENTETTDAEILQLVGPPVFPGGCVVEGAIDALVAGQPSDLRLCARITEVVEGELPALDITHLPPGVGVESVAQTLSTLVQNRAELPLRGLYDASTANDSRLRCVLRPEANPDDVEPRLRDVWGVSITVQFDLGRSVAAMVRSWAADGVGPSEIPALRELLASVSNERD